jgi:hypothetical protein
VNAQLKPIPYALTRPTFDRTNVATAGVWIKDNYTALKAYYADLGRSLPEDDDTNLAAFAKAQRFLSFCVCQHDRERGVL